MYLNTDSNSYNGPYEELLLEICVDLQFETIQQAKIFYKERIYGINDNEKLPTYFKFNTKDFSYHMIDFCTFQDKNIKFKFRADEYIDNITWFKDIIREYNGDFKVYAINLDSVELMTERFILSNKDKNTYNIELVTGDYIRTLFFNYDISNKFNVKFNSNTSLYDTDATFFSIYDNKRVKTKYETNKLLDLFYNLPERYKKYKQGIYDDCSLIFLRWEYMSTNNRNYLQLKDSDKVKQILELSDKVLFHSVLLSYYGVEYEKDFVYYLIKFENCHNVINKEIKNLLLNRLNKDFSPIICNSEDEVYMLSYYITDSKLIEELMQYDYKFLSYANDDYLSKKLLMIKQLKEM